MICTFYSHHVGFDRVVETIKKTIPKCNISKSENNGSEIALVEITGGLFSSNKKMEIKYRQRNMPSYKFPDIDDSPVTTNLKGLYGYVTSLQAYNEKLKGLFLRKIETLNSEFTLTTETDDFKELKSLIFALAKEFEAIIFAQPNTPISKSSGQHFLDESGNLLLDNAGNSEISDLKVTINSMYFDDDQFEVTERQITRKVKNEKILEEKSIKVNKNLPYIEDDEVTTIRSPREIAERVTILAMTNLVAFNNLSGDEAIDYLQQHELWDLVTPNEKAFLENPTDEKKSYESWKCEGIWTLLWALNKVDDLRFPDVLANLNDIPQEEYPVGPDKDPNHFIEMATESRSKEEILDANDLYYRLDWACVDARINNMEMTLAHPGVVYERLYALNWLINYSGQEWDDVSCDT